MLTRFQSARGQYPRQFWLMFYGMLISTIGSSMIWPFLMIYVSSRLRLPLATVAGLMAISSAAGLISSLLAGPVVDRAGRKWVMVFSLLLNACGYLLMSQAKTLGSFALLMALNGAVNPLYRVGADAMMADLVPSEKRMDAYSLMRMSNNLGIAVGPAVGGLIAAASYNLAFYCAATGLAIYGALVALFAVETLPGRRPETAQGTAGGAAVRARTVLSARSLGSFSGYGALWRDRPYLGFLGAFTLIQICAALVWVLMAVYAKQNYGVPESQYGFIAATNAVMVVLFQILVTGFIKRYNPLRTVALGAAFYAMSVGGVALATGFLGFWLAMVVMTIGELIIVPTSSTYVANRAPIDMRGRYMSLYSLTWGIASGVGPVLGGLVNDNIGPRWTWVGGAMIGLCAVFSFLWLARRAARSAQQGVGEGTQPALAGRQY